MSLTDPIADMLTRIRNAQARGHEKIDMPASKIRVEVCRVLKQEGYIRDYRLFKEDGHNMLTVMPKYTDESKGTITTIKRVSRPSRRVYVGKDDVPLVLNGLGVAILSTSKGILTDAEARKAGIGGEVLCEVW